MKPDPSQRVRTAARPPGLGRGCRGRGSRGQNRGGGTRVNMHRTSSKDQMPGTRKDLELTAWIPAGDLPEPLPQGAIFFRAEMYVN